MRKLLMTYVQSKAHQNSIRDVWVTVVGASQLLDYPESDIGKKIIEINKN